MIEAEQHPRQENILPCAETYEKEMIYFPWGKLIEEVAEYVIEHAPKNGSVMDIMCGPGFLLGRIKEKRPDLKVVGVDINEGFLDHAHLHHPDIDLIIWMDVLQMKIVVPFDVILCTGGIHHVPFERQPELLAKMRDGLKDNGFAIIADPFTREHYDNIEFRRCKLVELGCEYLIATIKNIVPDDIVKSAVDIIANDILGIEFKTCIRIMWRMLTEIFSIESYRRVWPKWECFSGQALPPPLRSGNWPPDCDNDVYGDFYFILKKRKSEEV